MHLPNSSERTSGCSGEVVLEELSLGPEPTAAAVLGNDVVGGAVSAGLGDGSDHGM